MKFLFFISMMFCLSVFATETNKISTFKENCISNNFVKKEFQKVVEPIKEEKSSALQNGTLRQIADQNNPRSYQIENGKKTILHNEKGRRTGTAKSYKIDEGITSTFIRDRKGKKVGNAKTYSFKSGMKKTVLRDENDNKIGSMSKIGGHTVYRDANGKRISRKEAKSLGLR